MSTKISRLLALAASAALTFISLDGLALYAQHSREVAIARHLDATPVVLAAQAAVPSR